MSDATILFVGGTLLCRTCNERAVQSTSCPRCGSPRTHRVTVADFASAPHGSSRSRWFRVAALVIALACAVLAAKKGASIKTYGFVSPGVVAMGFALVGLLGGMLVASVVGVVLSVALLTPPLLFRLVTTPVLAVTSWRSLGRPASTARRVQDRIDSMLSSLVRPWNALRSRTRAGRTEPPRPPSIHTTDTAEATFEVRGTVECEAPIELHEQQGAIVGVRDDAAQLFADALATRFVLRDEQGASHAIEPDHAVVVFSGEATEQNVTVHSESVQLPTSVATRRCSLWALRSGARARVVAAAEQRDTPLRGTPAHPLVIHVESP